MKEHVSNTCTGSCAAFRGYSSHLAAACRQGVQNWKDEKMSGLNLVSLVKGGFHKPQGHFSLPLCFLPISSSSQLTLTPFFLSFPQSTAAACRRLYQQFNQRPALHIASENSKSEHTHTRLVDQAHALYIHTPSAPLSSLINYL